MFVQLSSRNSNKRTTVQWIPNAPDVKMLRRWLPAAGCSDGLFQSEVMHGLSENFVDAQRCRIHNSLAEETNSDYHSYCGAIPMGQETPVPPRPQ